MPSVERQLLARHGGSHLRVDLAILRSGRQFEHRAQNSSRVLERRLVVRVNRRKTAPEGHAGAGKYAQQVRDLTFSDLDAVDQQAGAGAALLSLLDLPRDWGAARR